MGEEEELYNLVHLKLKHPSLQPIPSLTLIHEAKIQRKFSHLPKASASLLKNATSTEEEQAAGEVFKPKLPKSFYITKLKEWAEEIPISGLMSTWESNILKLIPKNLKTKYPKCLQQLLADIKQIYVDEMQEFAVSSIVINEREPDAEESEDDTAVVETEKPIVTKGNVIFMRNQNQLQQNYFLRHNLIKHVIATAREKLTFLIVDFSTFRSLGLLNLSDFQQMIKRNIRKSTMVVKHEYYKEIMKRVLTKKYLKSINKNDELQFMHCVTNIFVQQIVQNMMETINRMLAMIKDTKFCPQLNFELSVARGIKTFYGSKNISLKPPIDVVCKFYHQIIDDISNMVKNDLLPFKCEDLSENYIQVCVPEWFLLEAHDKLSQILGDLFGPLKNHFSYIIDEFTYVSSAETRNFIISLVSEGENFEIYCDHVKNFNRYLEKTNELVSYVYYDIGKLNQVNARDNLHKNTSDLVKILMDKMVNYHWSYNRAIYDEFESLRDLALDIPKETKALFELAETISHASATTLDKLEEKLIYSVEMLAELLQLTYLSEEHIEFNKATINWLASMSDVFVQSNTACEAMKSELEDELQRKINVLNAEVEEIIPEFIIMDNMDDATRVHEYIDFLNVLVGKVKEIDREINAINVEEKLFKFPETTFPRVDEIKDVIMPFYNLNKMIFLWRRHNSVWLDGPFEYINSAEVEKITLYYFNEFTELNKNMKTKIKLDMTTPNRPFKFSGIIDDPDPMQQPAPLKLCFQVIQHVRDFKQYVRLVNCMCNPALAKRHWSEMSVIYGSDITPNAGTTLRKIIALDLLENIEKYEVISISANKELALQKQLDSMAEEWNDVDFNIVEVAKGKQVFVNFQDIQIRMEEHLVKIQEMKGSYFVKPIAEDVVAFHRGLICIRNTINQWNHLQDELMIIRPVFIYSKKLRFERLEKSKEIDEAEKVEAVEEVGDEFDEIFDICVQLEDKLNQVRDQIVKNPTFSEIAKTDEYLKMLKMCLSHVETVNEKIFDYLNKIKRFFPRFFFLSDFEIMECLFNEHEDYNLERTRRLLRKCFSGIKSIKVNSENEVTAIFSDYDQEFELFTKINLHSDNWLVELENSIVGTVKTTIELHAQQISPNFANFTQNFILGIVSVCMCNLKILWTSRVSEALENDEDNLKNLKLLLENHISWISDVISQLKSENTTRKILRKNQRLMLITLSLTLLHQRDVISSLISNEVTSTKDFNWIAQLRHHLIEKMVKVEMIYETKDYGYEFNSMIHSQIVNTPLTDRIYHTVFQSGLNGYFCYLMGPADTGKVETVKYLAVNELGVQFHLINCTENLTCDRISNYLKGLIACGAWICFKNFNQVKVSVLSATTEKFDAVLKITSKETKDADVNFDGDLLQIKSTGFIAATMRVPPGSFSKYQPDRNFPNNLRVLFRPITVSHPDIQRICEVQLFSCGFESAKSISKKIQVIWTFSSEQLNSQRRYLFSVRSLISIIRNVTRLKFQFADADEEALILRSIVDVCLPVLMEPDILIFLGLLRDIFPGVKMFPPTYANFLKTVDEVAASDGFQLNENFKLKLIQILEVLYIKHAFVIVGEAFTGKTTILRVLAKTLRQLLSNGDNMGADVVVEIINHKSMKLENLFGYYEVKDNNRKWIDGICTSIFRDFTNINRNYVYDERKWLIFDGDIESSWMDNLMTVLDGNKTLHLDSSDKIQISESTSVVFETESLKNSSPAIISRCGVVHMEGEATGWKSHVECWIQAQNSYVKPKKNEYMRIFLRWMFENCLQFMEQCTSVMNITRVHLVIATLRLLKIFLREAFDANAKDGSDAHFDTHFELWFQACLIQSAVWGMGGTLSSEDQRNKLDEFCVTTWSKKPENIRQPDLALPEGMIQDHSYIFKAAGVWKSWAELMKNTTEYFADVKFIPTTNTIRLMSIFEAHIRQKVPFILCGDRSIGKTTLMQYILKKKLPKSSNKYLPNVFNFTCRTAAHQAQNFFLLKINRIMRGHYAPPRDKYSINFIDDLNMMVDNAVDRNSGQPLELIRQLIDHGFWYGANENEEKFKKIIVENVMFLSALTLSERVSDISSRFVRHFNLYCMNTPSRENVVRIFSMLLLNNLKRNAFSADVSTSVNAMVNATLQVYNAVRSNKNLRAIPFNSFKYLFNLRDVYRVICGCSLIHKESAETKVVLIRLWAHETCRVFGDRFASKDHSAWLFSTIKEAITFHFNKESFDSIFDHLPKQSDQLTFESFDNLMFCNFMDSSDHKDEPRKRYEEVTSSRETLKGKIVAYLNQLNDQLEEDKKMDVMIFSDIVTHLVRLCRCLCTPSGNFLMLSTGGGSAGRRSLTKLSAFIEKSEFFELSNHSNWREDLKTATKLIVATGSDCCFFIPCRYLKDDHLMDMNCLIATGEIPDLFVRDEERQAIIETARLPAQNGDRNLEIGIVEVMNYFHEQCQEKLHFVIYINLFDEMRCQVKSHYSLLKSYVNILNFCFIDCFEDWPLEAFTQLGTKFIQDMTVVSSFTRERLVAAAIDIYQHTSEMKIINNYKTTTGPYAFIHMMRLYSDMTSRRHEKIVESRHRYQVGLEKLQYAEQEVSKMKNILTDLKPQLEWSAKQTEETMREIETENVIVENASIQVKKDEEIANNAAEIAAILKSECEADLAVAIPILEDAIAALNTLKPTDITLVKAMKNPPDTIKLVMAAVCVMLNIPSDRVIDPVTGKKSMDYWGPSKRILGEMNFLQMLKDYDKDNIPAALMQVVKKTYMTDRSFMPHIVAKASSAAEGLCKWVRAMVSYDEVAKIVAPKKEKLAGAEKECNEALDFLNEKRKTLAELNKKLTALNETLQGTLARKYELESEVRSCTEKLEKSEGLILSLDGEKMKWKNLFDTLKSSLDNLPGDLLMSCGIVAFLASYDEECRSEAVEAWKEILERHNIAFSNSYNFHLSLESKIVIDSWHLVGLSRNRFYSDNAVITNNSRLCCLLIDPQNQANLWIRSLEKKNHLKIFKFAQIQQSNCLEQIEFCMKQNYPILLENLGENFRPTDLDNIYGDGKQSESVKIRFYMTTRLCNPNFNPYILKKTNVINFHLPHDALHNQLLDIVVSREKPQLQEKFNALSIKSNANKQILKQEEKNILTTLSSTSTTVSILEDEKALKVLDTSKKLTMQIQKEEEAAHFTKLQIDESRKQYSSFTHFCANLYHTLTSLTALNYMYQFSVLGWYTKVFMKSIDSSKRSTVIKKRIEYLKCSFTQTLHTSVRNALFDDHKIVYSFLLCLKMLSSDNDTIKQEEINFFFNSIRNFVTRKFDGQTRKFSDQIPVEELTKLIEALPVFDGVIESLKFEETSWQKFRSSREVEDDSLPAVWEAKLTSFQKLILARILTPEKLVEKVKKFISLVKEQFHLSFSSLSGISGSFSESTCLVPLIFILPTYVEPLEIITEFGQKLGYTSKVFAVSLGGDDDDNVGELILHCQREGLWIYVGNCHLAKPSVLSLLEKIYEDQNKENTALLGFRLWLSSCPSVNFPIGILQDGIKMTYDTPKNVKQSLLATYEADPLNKMQFFNSCPGKDKIFAKMIYGLSLFHSILRERRKFGNQGWNIGYEFYPSDLKISLNQLQNLLLNVSTSFSAKEKNDFTRGIFYLVKECNYGGRIVDDNDAKYLSSILEDFCNSEFVNRKNYCIFNEFSDHFVIIPDRCEYKDFVRHIENISDSDAILEVFGLDYNVKMKTNSVEVEDFVSSLNLLNEETTFVKKEKIAANITTEVLQEIQGNLPEMLDIRAIKCKYFSNYSEPLNYVLIHEIEDFNLTICQIKNLTVENLPNFSNTYQQNLLNSVEKLAEKSHFLNNWIENDFPRMPIKLHLLSNPKRFMSTVKIMFSRECAIRITEISLKAQILDLKNVDTAKIFNDKKTIYIEGLHICGGKLDLNKGILVLNSPKEFWNSLPMIRLTAELNELKSCAENQDKFHCPLYKSVSGRDVMNFSGNLENYIDNIELRTEISHRFWVKRGTALFCNIY